MQFCAFAPNDAVLGFMRGKVSQHKAERGNWEGQPKRHQTRKDQREQREENETIADTPYDGYPWHDPHIFVCNLALKNVELLISERI